MQKTGPVSAEDAAALEQASVISPFSVTAVASISYPRAVADGRGDRNSVK